VRAARYYGKQDIRVEEVPTPQVREPDDVLVEVAYCGICGTDLHEYVVGPIVTPTSPHPLTGAQLPQTMGSALRVTSANRISLSIAQVPMWVADM
jgi:(R,R)-butanediol dehydrogenase/meso-butanediol dehydrogenase/diacetyl reductase